MAEYAASSSDIEKSVKGSGFAGSRCETEPYGPVSPEKMEANAFGWSVPALSESPI